MPEQPSRRSRGRPRKDPFEPPPPSSQTLNRALVLLKTVAGHDGLSLTDLGALTGLPPSTVHRLLSTLATHGLVELSESDQTWAIGVEALRIGAAFHRRNRLASAGRGHMQKLMEATGETVNLALLDQGSVVFIAQIECPEPLRAFFRSGERRAIHASGIGKAILAAMPAERRTRTLAGRHLDRLTARTLTDPAALARDLEHTRRRGWALDDEEANPGMRCVAAAIFNEFGEAVAGVSISGPAARLTADRLADFGHMVRTCAEEITNATGGIIPNR